MHDIAFESVIRNSADVKTRKSEVFENMFSCRYNSKLHSFCLPHRNSTEKSYNHFTPAPRKYQLIEAALLGTTVIKLSWK